MDAISLSEAQEAVLACARSFGMETLPLAAATGRVLAVPIAADRDYPPFDRATMDGYAVQSADFQSVEMPVLRLLERIQAGRVGERAVAAGTCSQIMTGAPLPTGADAVVRVEDTQEAGGKVAFEKTTVRPGQNVARRGEDARSGHTLLPANVRITAQVAGVLAVCGHADVAVARLPRVAVFSTGDEVVPLGGAVQPHQIRDSNAWTLRAFLAGAGVASVTAAHVPDDRASLAAAVAGGLRHHDMLVLSGGVSKGTADYVPQVLEEAGVRRVFHRVRVKPGGPVWFGVGGGGQAVFGLPGNPVSVQVGCKLFVEPYLRACFGLPPLPPLLLPFAGDRIKKTPFEEFFPVRLHHGGGITGVEAVPYNSSGDIAATALSHGVAWHPAAIARLAPGHLVRFFAW